LVPCLLERHRVRAGIARLQSRERAEETARDADVRRLESNVEVIERAAAVTLLALAVGQPADREQIGTVEQADAVRKRQADTRIELLRDVGETSDCEPKMHRARNPTPDPRQDMPKICIRSDRARGPSSSAMRMRCHCPSTTSPPLTCSVRLWPRSSARRCESAFMRSQSECSGSFCIQAASRATICSRK